MKRKTKTFSLNKKKHTRSGIVSSVLAVCSLLIFLGAVILSVSTITESYQGPITIGVLELFSILTTLAGLVFAFIGIGSKDTNKYYAHMGIGLNLFLLIIHVFILINGYWSI